MLDLSFFFRVKICQAKNCILLVKGHAENKTLLADIQPSVE